MKDMKNAIKHLREHQSYPATREELVLTCNSLADFSDEDKQWFSKNLPEGTYNSAEEVMKALGMSGQKMQATM